MAKSMLVIVICCLVSNWVVAQETCPIKERKTDFDIHKYVGRWYEIMRVASNEETDYTCMFDEYAEGPDGVDIISMAYNTSTQQYVILQGQIPESSDGSFDITYTKKSAWNSKYDVLDTDYATYVVLWGCLVDDAGVMHALSWVSSKERSIDDATLEKVKQVMGDHGLNFSDYEYVVQDNCPAIPDV